MEIRTRYAPSPTGPLHLGGARTALFNYLFAKKSGGKYILRIEDTDLERSDKKYEKDIFESFEWLGIKADEGPETGGPYGPYRQGERIDTYKNYIEKLLARGAAFYCFHSERELEEEKEKLLAAKKPSLHLCEYHAMDPKETKLLTETKSNYIIRFKTPAGRKLVFKDLIRGELSFDSDLLGDFSIAKRPDVPLYNFAVVVDDFEMKISHVIRGEDHISNTPKQLLMVEALGFDLPQYAHLPLILGPDRSKLSKRHGASSVGEYRKAGYLPEALFNFMALLGWNPGDEREVLSREDLIKEFSLEKVQKSGAIFDINKLEWMNGEYIRKLSLKELAERAKPFFHKNKKLKSYLEKILALEQPRLKKLSEIKEKTDYFFRAPEYDRGLLRWKDMTDEEIAASLDKSIELLQSPRLKSNFNQKELEKAFIEEIVAGDKGRLLWPLRVALTGKKASPGPFDIMEILGGEEALKRLKAAKEKLRG
ncbi:MAG: glutamate--tRNA ligase [Candidatus Sungiibacteriota bacterium]|uniref:Glutamate--tRNA ligase n=1 Tax=Candidatus Sungiibacteriota bacterium TaxID=2750080 RepID=A0A7T5RJH5_9BACT|nr:MAG: glutamate--tRNA ligase [Candidatus Sungbacteria bacterium]